MGFGDFSEVFLTEKTHRTLASGAPTHLVNSDRSTCEGAERADAGRGTLTRPVHFCGPPDAGDRTQCVSIWSRRCQRGAKASSHAVY
jgi:hypothetical protein